jgi:hypothetical protein
MKILQFIKEGFFTVTYISCLNEEYNIFNNIICTVSHTFYSFYNCVQI